MFDEKAFESWPYVFVGALLFAGLFACAALMVEWLSVGMAQVTRAVVGLGAAAFVGYVAMAILIRRSSGQV